MSVEKKAYSEICSLLTLKELPSHDVIFDITEKVSDLLEKENTAYRPSADNHSPGGLIKLNNSSLLSIIVPDLHARPDFLHNILDFHLPDGSSVFHALWNKKLNVIFVGDILHSERNTRERWLKIADEFAAENYTGGNISAEMQDGLSLLCGLLKLKELFPENCQILKGNHENILNATGNGDFGFKKYSDEGQMCKTFIQEFYGDDILYMIHCVERALPLMVLGKNYLVSHAEPKTAFSLCEVINCRNNKGVIEGLTWTANDDAEDGSVPQIIKKMTGLDDVSDFVYIGGHRPVTGKYNLRQNGMFVQIHNPSLQNIAIINSEKKFNPETDIVEVNK